MSTKRNIQCFREWAYSINALIIESTAGTTVIDPTLSSKDRNRLKWQNRRPKEI
jgi:hypothetical protein